MSKSRKKKKPSKRILALPDLEQAKSARPENPVLNPSPARWPWSTPPENPPSVDIIRFYMTLKASVPPLKFLSAVYALEGKSAEAVKWLREAAVTGYQLYPRYERDAYLNRIRQAPEFIQFLAEMKTLNDRYRDEFS